MVRGYCLLVGTHRLRCNYTRLTEAAEVKQKGVKEGVWTHPLCRLGYGEGVHKIYQPQGSAALTWDTIIYIKRYVAVPEYQSAPPVQQYMPNKQLDACVTLLSIHRRRSSAGHGSAVRLGCKC